MTRWSSCGLFLACSIAVAQPAAAGQAEEPRSYDLTLKQALDVARSRAPSIRAARLRSAEAHGQLLGASRALRSNPTLDVGGGVRMGPSGVGPEIDIGVGQVFELGGQRAARIDAASAGIDHASALAEDATRDTLRAVATVFLRAQYAGERLLIAASAERLAVELEEVAQRRHASGDVGVVDVALAAVDVARRQADRRRLEVTQQRSFGQLRLLLGLEPGAPVVLRGELLDRGRYRLSELLARADERADLRALAAAARGADAQARLGEALAWPDLGVKVGYSREEDADVAKASLSLTLPLFDRGEGLEATSRAKAETLRLERQLEEVSVRTSVRTSFDTYQRLLEAAEQFEAHALPPLERTDALATRSYEAGAMALSELLAVRRQLVDTRIDHAALLLDAALAGVDLEAEAGLLR